MIPSISETSPRRSVASLPTTTPSRTRFSACLERIKQCVKYLWQKIQFWSQQPFAISGEPSLRLRFEERYKRLHGERVSRPITFVSRAPVVEREDTGVSVEHQLGPIADPTFERLRSWALGTSKRVVEIKLQDYRESPGAEEALKHYRDMFLEAPEYLSRGVEFLFQLQKDATPFLNELRNAPTPEVRERLREAQRELLSILIPSDREAKGLLRDTLEREIAEIPRFTEMEVRRVVVPLFTMEVSELVEQNDPEVDKVYDAALLLLIKYKMTAIQKEMAESSELQDIADYFKKSVVEPNLEHFVDYSVHRFADVVNGVPYPATLNALVEGFKGHLEDIVQERNHAILTDEQLRRYSHERLGGLLHLLFPSGNEEWDLAPLFELLVVPEELRTLKGQTQRIIDNFIRSGVITHVEKRLGQLLTFVMSMAKHTLQWQVSEYMTPWIIKTITHYSKPEELRAIVATVALPLISSMLVRSLAQDLIVKGSPAMAHHFYGYLDGVAEAPQRQVELLTALWEQFSEKYADACIDDTSPDIAVDGADLDIDTTASSFGKVSKEEFFAAAEELVSGLCEKLEARHTESHFTDDNEVKLFLSTLQESSSEVDEEGMAAAKPIVDILLQLLFDIGHWRRTGERKETRGWFIETGLRSNLAQKAIQKFIAPFLSPYRSSPHQLLEKGVSLLEEKTAEESDLRSLMNPRQHALDSAVDIEGEHGRLRGEIKKVSALATPLFQILLPSEAPFFSWGGFMAKAVKYTVGDWPEAQQQLEEVISNLVDHILDDAGRNQQLLLRIADIVQHNFQQGPQGP